MSRPRVVCGAGTELDIKGEMLDLTAAEIDIEVDKFVIPMVLNAAASELDNEKGTPD